MQEILNELKVGDALGEGLGKDSRQQQRKREKFKRRAQYPEMEAKLYIEYKELRKKGLKMKGWWFRLHAQQILTELEPDTDFQFSNGWFLGFKKRHRISMRRATRKSQETRGQLYNTFIVTSAKKQQRESIILLDLWANGLLAKWPTWIKLHCLSASVMERSMLTPVSSLCGCEDGALGWRRANARFS